MASNVVQLSESNGAVETVTDGITNINFGSADTPNMVANNHQIIKGLQSYAKWIRFKLVTNNNTSDSVIVVYKSAGALVTGESIGTNMILSPGNFTTSIIGYGQKTQGAGGTSLSPIPYSGGAPSGISGNVLATTAGAENLSIGNALGNTLTANGTYSNYTYFQLFTTASTPLGPVNTKTFTFQYNEV